MQPRLCYVPRLHTAMRRLHAQGKGRCKMGLAGNSMVRAFKEKARQDHGGVDFPQSFRADPRHGGIAPSHHRFVWQGPPWAVAQPPHEWHPSLPFIKMFAKSGRSYRCCQLHSLLASAHRSVHGRSTLFSEQRANLGRRRQRRSLLLLPDMHGFTGGSMSCLKEDCRAKLIRKEWPQTLSDAQMIEHSLLTCEWYRAHAPVAVETIQAIVEAFLGELLLSSRQEGLARV